FTLANVVYQGHAGGLDPEQLWQVGRLATGGLEPDLTIVFDLAGEEALARRQRPPDRFESRGPAYHARGRGGFRTEARRNPDWICVVDAGPRAELVHEVVLKVVRTRLGI